MIEKKKMVKRKVRQRRVSSVDVAREAGVSQATVSRVFNRTKGTNVSEETVAKIMQTAKRLNYRPSVIARSLQQNSTNIIGIINRNFESNFHMQSLDMFSRELQKLGYSTLLLNLPEDGTMDATLHLALEYQVDGIILTSTMLSSRLAEDCISYDTPVVQYNRYSLYQEVDSVCLDNFKAGNEVGKYLIETGHKRIAFVSGRKESSTSIDRRLGLIHSLDEAGLPLVAEYTGEYTHESGCEAADAFIHGISRDQWPDAVFCGTDIAATGFIDHARRAYGIRVPEDISVAGFDDTPMATWPQYDLTTVMQPIETMVQETLEILMDLIKYEKSGVIKKMIPGTLVKRSSVIDRR
ncbi:MAG: LacI family DNA-binding transcriptional regulator [Spirochaetia bacterium]|nr:LacI family DNA-binding transcriptional regulator [Spirochaetia bacterium]MCF7942019.1 LacI family DNA-binding transcriptional regulator [Spirochaetia bacterium]